MFLFENIRISKETVWEFIFLFKIVVETRQIMI